MKTLRWTWFFIIIIFCVLPRLFYVIKFLLPKESESNGGYDAYANLSEAAKEVINK